MRADTRPVKGAGASTHDGAVTDPDGQVRWWDGTRCAADASSIVAAYWRAVPRGVWMGVLAVLLTFGVLVGATELFEWAVDTRRQADVTYDLCWVVDC